MPPLLPARLTEDFCRKYSVWVLLAVTALLYLPGLGTLPMMDRDEPRFAHATVEMMQRGTWTIPYFNGDFRFDKPPLTYWWMRLYYNLFGINEMAARLHTVFATWFVALVVFSIAKRTSGARAGLLGGFAWLITLQVLVHGRLCVADMPMVLFVALAMRAVLELMLSPPAAFSRWHWLLYGALGLGFLAKGPIAWLVPVLVLGLHRWAFWRKPFAWSSLHIGKGSLITLAIAGSWGIPALVETHGLFWKVGMGEHVVARGTTAFNGRFPVPGYYLLTGLASLFPWIALLPQVWCSVRAQWNSSIALFVSWMVAPYIVFSLYATQLAHYVMPGFPAAMVLIAVCGIDCTGPRWHRWWSGFVIGLFVILTAAAIWGSSMADLPDQLRLLLLHGSFLLGLLAGLALSIVLRAMKGERFPFAAIVSVLLLLPFPLYAVMNDLRVTHPAVQLAPQVGTLPANAELMGWQFTEPSLVFHFNHEWKFSGKLETVTKHLDRGRPNVAVLLRREWTLSKALHSREPARDFSKEVDALISSHPDHRVIRFNGFDAARSSWVELVVLSKLSSKP